ncbi:MAG: U32 family peptidase [Desulfobacteraceae bacterium]|nr:U32 family peptidase [Desulfobacteraceae bacterium]MBC2756722.1 U32 family peptidase [Desulfobacteraceae bacterium]
MDDRLIINNSPNKQVRPEILAPAGGKKAFLAALAAGADAVYCGLKRFSARMAAENFSIDELGQLTQLAHDQGKKVYIPINTMIKSDELAPVGRLLDQLNRWVQPDALIVQDLAMISLARQTGFSGEIHLSTLSNITFPAALELVRKFPEIKRVVLPRELSIDEIKMAAAACPDELSLEIFIHGALCYAVSGRCYWSSYMGGKSGLRGRCVQPCRRVYTQDSRKNRFFSCQDLSIDVLTKIVAGVPKVSSLKIEGRKKGPHYVYYTVSAYRLLRDNFDDPKAKKTALAFLDYALGRKGTHYNFLPQRPQNPVNLSIQTGSGLMIGSVKGERAKSYIVPREALYANDMLRIGYEDDAWHTTFRVSKYVPKKGQLFLKFAAKRKPQNGTPVFLIDRREPEVEKEMRVLENQLGNYSGIKLGESAFKIIPPSKNTPKGFFQEMRVMRSMQGLKQNTWDPVGVWLASDTKRIIVGDRRRSWYWLPPVIWPDDQEKMRSLVKEALKKGCRNFVLNSPWQRVFFPKDKSLNLWAGPFCNISNELAIEQLAGMQFKGVIVSPELGKTDYAGLPSKSLLPLGIVVSGNWPLCVSRIISDDLKTAQLFNSPKGEQAWARQYGSDFWVFPNWQVDLTPKKEALKKAGYKILVHLSEPLPKKVKLKQRPGLWNWEIGLK